MLILFVLVMFVSTFLLASVAVVIASRVLDRRRQAAGAPAETAGFDEAPALLKLEELSSISLWDNLLTRFDFMEKMRAKIAEANLSWSVGRLTSLMLLIGAFTMAVLSSVSWMPFWLSFALAGAAAAAPYLYVLSRRAKRLAEFEKTFPDALDFLARSLRAGHPLPVALELLSTDEPDPLAAEMRKTADERKLGMPLDQALSNLSKRVPLLNVRIFVAAVRLQSRAGGKLSDVLNNLSEQMREAYAVEGEVQSLAAHGRMTGSVLTVMPVIIATLMTIVNPGYLNILFENETGKTLVIICGIALVAAHIVIRKIVRIRL